MDKRSWIGFALAAAASAAMAQATPQGLWRTIDDDSGKEKSLVRIVDNGGVFGGRIEKLLDPSKQDAKCDKCSDARKGQPVLGMTILENVRKNADEPYWDGGTILDPNNGKSYRVRLTPKDGGKTLEVRGFIGPFYRNQTWQRVE
ncbi:hypothetical protein CLD22_18375 [Rubrivivax gelatinosus]|nr:hypothetical protein [Rubrivivax gelatinosus]